MLEWNWNYQYNVYSMSNEMNSNQIFDKFNRFYHDTHIIKIKIINKIK